jgi:flagellar biosynthesis protein FlhA
MAVQPAEPQSRLTRYTDIIMAVAILTIVGMLIVPMPDWLLDLGIAFNLTIGVVIVLVTLYCTEPLQFSVFPSLLLVTTLFRLALNIAATKLILATGQPGHIIEAFGNVVVQGNFVVGVIAFLILVVVQFVVITNGAGRVAEVAARFTLDAMPGKQMAIDADLNAGLIDETQARTRRKTIEQEADFYGAMDGASKFVRGDAIAAVLIIIINIVGGFVMGMVNGQGDALTILQTYTLLTIGEGLVSQIPALLISTATGLMVTRAGSDSNMGHDFFTQMFAKSRPLFLAGGLLVVLFLVPGFPKLPLALVGGLVLFSAFLLVKNEKQEAVVAAAEDVKAKAVPKPPEDPHKLLSIDTLLVELGSNLVPLALPNEGGDLAERVGGARRQIAVELGIVLPMVRIKDNLQLNPNEYVLKIRDQIVARYQTMPHHLLAIDTGAAGAAIEGIPTKEPAFGGDALWIPKHLRDRAAMAGYFVTDPAYVLITHLTEIIRKHAHELLTRQDTQGLMENVKQHNKAVTEELSGFNVSLGDIHKVLQNLLRERVSIRDLNTILEAMADWAGKTKDVDQLSEYARAALARQICSQVADDEGVVPALSLAPTIDKTLRESLQLGLSGAVLALDPNYANEVIGATEQEIDRLVRMGHQPVLMVSSQIRLALRRLIERRLPNLFVLAYNEIAAADDVRVLGAVELNRATAELAA